ncbi:MAG: biotin--[acetyl-CoA-carboxylase] ligase [Proteobacteria bacterium]|nr:biotin--[acetyl-CoA-carboxylase] ligase [Pseudomonadota bacterium]
MKLIANHKYKNFTIHHYDEILSTNQSAYNLAENRQIFDRELILANLQTKGRGRLDRAWSSPLGNLYFSLILQPKINLNQISKISFVVSCAIQKTFEKIFNQFEIQAEIKNKWPNDLLINNQKVAGILIEGKNSENLNEFLVVGVGINVISNPTDTIFPATNLASFSINISTLDLLKLFLDEFEVLYENWLKFGFKNIRELWLKNAFNLDQNIIIKPNNISISGVFKNIDDDGNILIEVDNKIMKFFCGDIFI